MPPWAAVVGGNQAADRRAVGPWRIERNPLAMPRQFSVHLGERGTGLNSRRQIAVAMGHNVVQSPRRQQHINRTRRGSPSQLRAGAASQHRKRVARRPGKRVGDRFGAVGLDDKSRDDAVNGIVRRAGASLRARHGFGVLHSFGEAGFFGRVLTVGPRHFAAQARCWEQLPGVADARGIERALARVVDETISKAILFVTAIINTFSKSLELGAWNWSFGQCANHTRAVGPGYYIARLWRFGTRVRVD